MTAAHRCARVADGVCAEPKGKAVPRLLVDGESCRHDRANAEAIRRKFRGGR